MRLEIITEENSNDEIARIINQGILSYNQQYFG